MTKHNCVSTTKARLRTLSSSSFTSYIKLACMQKIHQMTMYKKLRKTRKREVGDAILEIAGRKEAALAIPDALKPALAVVPVPEKAQEPGSDCTVDEKHRITPITADERDLSNFDPMAYAPSNPAGTTKLRIKDLTHNYMVCLTPAGRATVLADSYVPTFRRCDLLNADGERVGHYYVTANERSCGAKLHNMAFVNKRSIEKRSNRKVPDDWAEKRASDPGYTHSSIFFTPYLPKGNANKTRMPVLFEWSRKDGDRVQFEEIACDGADAVLQNIVIGDMLTAAMADANATIANGQHSDAETRNAKKKKTKAASADEEATDDDPKHPKPKPKPVNGGDLTEVQQSEPAMGGEGETRHNPNSNQTSPIAHNSYHQETIDRLTKAVQERDRTIKSLLVDMQKMQAQLVESNRHKKTEMHARNVNTVDMLSRSASDDDTAMRMCNTPAVDRCAGILCLLHRGQANAKTDDAGTR